MVYFVIQLAGCRSTLSMEDKNHNILNKIPLLLQILALLINHKHKFHWSCHPFVSPCIKEYLKHIFSHSIKNLSLLNCKKIFWVELWHVYMGRRCRMSFSDGVNLRITNRPLKTNENLSLMFDPPARHSPTVHLSLSTPLHLNIKTILLTRQKF